MWQLKKNKYFYLAKLMRNERNPLDEILASQEASLCRLVRHAYENVPFYKVLYDDAGIKPSDIRSVSDLKYLPIISKSDFDKYDVTHYLDKNNNDKSSLQLITTSGSSGKPMKFYIDNDYDQFRKAQFLRPYFSNGRKINDHVMRFSEKSHVKQKWFQKIGLLRESFVFADSGVRTQVAELLKLKPNVIQGYGSELLLLAKEIINKGVRIKSPKIVFTDSELLTLDARELIKTAFSADVIDIYGTYETDNIAYECFEHSGYHVAEDCVVMEFLDEAMQAVQPGCEGEMVLTVLNNHTMPLIRYRIGDVGGYLLDTCQCGRSFPIMKQVVGRLNDFALTENGGHKSTLGLLANFKTMADKVAEFQIHQKDINDFEVKIVSKGELTKSIADDFKFALRSEFPNAKISVKEVEKIERTTAGKLKAFVQHCSVKPV